MTRSPARALRGALIPLALFFGALMPAAAQAVPIVKLHASFTPERLGQSTTIGFGFTIKSADGTLPPPLIHLGLRIPKGVNYVNTDLGLAICRPKNLIAKGLSGCSPNARLGFGKAIVEVPFGTGSGREIPHIDALMGPEHDGNTVVLFYADGREPVFAQLVFQGELLPDSGPFSSDLSTTIPLIPSVPNGPPVSILNVESTIGPQHLLYEKRIHGHVVHYRPRGVSLPERCPRGGFRFVGDFVFQDGSNTTSTYTIPCPSAKGQSHK